MEYRGAIYPLLNRGEWREEIFKEAEDRTWFLETLGETARKTGQRFAVSMNHRGFQ